MRARRQEVAPQRGDVDILGKDPRTVQVLGLIRQVGPTPTTVLIRGESGTGKELTARAIHQHSHRSDKPLVAVNCTTLTDSLLESELFGHEKGAFTGAVADKKGLFEAANGGTIFLDEIGDITPKLQAELLRVLDSGEIRPVGGNAAVRVDVRLIAATNKNLEAGVKEGWFREDLFYRLNVIHIVVPPLRERREDIPLLVSEFLAQFAVQNRSSISAVSPDAMKVLMEYAWPGNVRELENACERMVQTCGCNHIRTGCVPSSVLFHAKGTLPEAVAPPPGEVAPVSLDERLQDVERSLITWALRSSGGNKSRAAELLKVKRSTLGDRIEKLGITA